jgi:hypothetical protein
MTCAHSHWATRKVEFAVVKIRAALMKAFVEEDKPMIEKQQARMGTADLWSLKPALLKTDSGAVWARRKLDALIEAEAGAMSRD